MMMMIQSSKKWAMIFATVLDEYETNYVSPVNTRFQPDIQSLASSALLLLTPLWQGRGGLGVQRHESSRAPRTASACSNRNRS
jgi:hypothetical protein